MEACEAWSPTANAIFAPSGALARVKPSGRLMEARSLSGKYGGSQTSVGESVEEGASKDDVGITGEAGIVSAVAGKSMLACGVVNWGIVLAIG